MLPRQLGSTDIQAGVGVESNGVQRQRRVWATPRVIVSDVSSARHNLVVITTDHTQFGGSSGGTLNS
jgi:hypothetical protein